MFIRKAFQKDPRGMWLSLELCIKLLKHVVFTFISPNPKWSDMKLVVQKKKHFVTLFI